MKLLTAAIIIYVIGRIACAVLKYLPL